MQQILTGSPVRAAGTSLLESASGGKRHVDPAAVKRPGGTETVVWVGGLQFVYAGQQVRRLKHAQAERACCWLLADGIEMRMEAVGVRSSLHLLCNCAAAPQAGRTRWVPCVF